jgi:diguanylate cyclase (GGDEF)-like protein/PAS domain S-box-containing protein
VLADSAPVLIWIAGVDKLCYQFNKTWLDFTGRTLEQEYGNGWAEGVHAEDLQRYLDTYIAAFEKREAFKMEYRLRRYDGQYRWLLDNGIPRFSDEGVFLGYIGSCIDIDERKQIEAALKASERKFRSIIEISPVPMVLNDGHDNIIFINPAFTKTFGYYLNEIPTLNVWRNKAYPDKQYREQIAALWQKQLQETEKTHNTFKPTELIIRTKSGVDKTVLASATAFESFDSLHLVVLYDISEHKQIEAELRIAATVFEAQEGMLITNAQNIILKVNHAFSAITGYSADDVIGQTPRLLRSGRQNKNFYTALWDTINNTGSWKGEIWEKRKNGQIYPAWLTITAVKDTASNTVTHYVATLTDITARKATEEYINRLAFYDALTQLPNRRLLQERLKYGIELSQRTGNQMAVLMLDLDRFKAVNDTLGHAAGDELLIQVAERIKACLRKVDLVARLGGDEFVILMDEIKHYKNVDRIAGLIIHKLNLPFTLSQNHVVNIGVSIGISLYPQHGNSPEILMDNADTALYRAKEQGRGCFVYFDFVVGAT